MKKITMLVAGHLLAVSGGSPALAQSESATANAGLQLEEVIVTAEKVDIDLQKTATSVQVYSGEQLAKEGKRRVDEVMQGIAGVNLQTGNTGVSFFIRGVQLGAGGVVAVPLIVDGVFQDRSDVARGGTLDVAQVEVARGTQATTIGANSLAGAITLVSNKPEFTYSANGSVEVGNFATRNLQGVLNVPVTDNQALRLAASTSRRDGYISSGAGENDLRQLRLRYRWRASDKLDMILNVNDQFIGGNGNPNNVLAYTGHWVGYDGSSIYSPLFNQSYIRNQLFTAPGSTTYQIAPGSILGPNAAPTTGVTTVANNGICNPVTGAGASISTTSTTTPFIASIDCPARYVLVRDNLNYWQRSNPWDDGFPQYGYPSQPTSNTSIFNVSADINWTLPLGTLTITPSVQRAANRSESAAQGTNWTSSDNVTHTRQLEVRLASPDESKIKWLGGLYYSWADGGPNFFPGTQVSHSFPVTTLAGNIASTGTTNCYNYNLSYCNALVERIKPGDWSTYSLYGNVTWPVLDKLRLLGGVRATVADYKIHTTTGPTFANGSLDDSAFGAFGVVASPLANGSCSTVGSPCYVRYDAFTPLTADSYTHSGLGSLKAESYVTTRTCLQVAPYTCTTTTTHNSNRTSNNPLSYRAGLEYDVLPSAMVYGAYSTGYQASRPGMGGSVAVPKPLTLEQLTLGLKSRWFDNRLQINVEAFNTDYHNRTVQDIFGGLAAYSATPGTGITCTVTAANPQVVVLGTTVGVGSGNSCFATDATTYYLDMRSKGVDFDLSFVPTGTDRIDLSAEWLQSRIVGVSGGINKLTVADLQALGGYSSLTAAQTAVAQTIVDGFNSDVDALPGTTPQNSPKWSGTLSYQHAFTFGNGSRFTPRVNASYKSVYWNQQTLTPATAGQPGSLRASNAALSNGYFYPTVQRGYTLYDLFTTWEAPEGKWSINTYIKNISNKPILLNTTAVTAGNFSSNSLQVASGSVTLAPPRTYGVLFTTSF